MSQTLSCITYFMSATLCCMTPLMSQTCLASPISSHSSSIHVSHMMKWVMQHSVSLMRGSCMGHETNHSFMSLMCHLAHVSHVSSHHEWDTVLHHSVCNRVSHSWVRHGLASPISSHSSSVHVSHGMKWVMQQSVSLMRGVMQDSVSLTRGVMQQSVSHMKWVMQDRVSRTCVTWMFGMCEMNESCPIKMSHRWDSFICVTWHESFVTHSSGTLVSGFYTDENLSYMWLDLICLWLIHAHTRYQFSTQMRIYREWIFDMCNLIEMMNLSCVWLDMTRSWLIHVCGLSTDDDAFICATCTNDLSYGCLLQMNLSYVWLVQMNLQMMDHSYVWLDTDDESVTSDDESVTWYRWWIFHMSHMCGLYKWSFICVTSTDESKILNLSYVWLVQMIFHMCETCTDEFTEDESFLCVTGYRWESFISVTWHDSFVTHSCVSLICVTWSFHICDLTHAWFIRDSFKIVRDSSCDLTNDSYILGGDLDMRVVEGHNNHKT